jgi:hemoglobin
MGPPLQRFLSGRCSLSRRSASTRHTVGCHHEGMRTVYEAAGGIDGLRRLASAWHTRVMADEVVSHAFSHGFHPEHTERLAAYWAEALGGPDAYSANYGDETTVVRMHSGNGPHDEMDRRAIACFDQALIDIGLAEADPLRHVLHDYFAWATTTTMSRYHESAEEVPEGLTIPRWSWSGLVK